MNARRTPAADRSGTPPERHAPITNDRPRRFAHPVEEEFAALLDFYRIPWQYEPRTFPLEWDEAGNLRASFTPDFYLPSEDLYVELTTLKPSLQNRKNRKIRKIQALYPDVRVKLFSRRHIRALARQYALKQSLEAAEERSAGNERE
ncbi:MAG: hypothetical protein HY320_13605 [Armatimonadetes bacterium]|nr:hypothetical protein [Armatimonadota bacterium]